MKNIKIYNIKNIQFTLIFDFTYRVEFRYLPNQWRHASLLSSCSGFITGVAERITTIDAFDSNFFINKQQTLKLISSTVFILPLTNKDYIMGEKRRSLISIN